MTVAGFFGRLGLTAVVVAIVAAIFSFGVAAYSRELPHLPEVGQTIIILSAIGAGVSFAVAIIAAIWEN